MIPVKFEGCNVTANPPAGFEEMIEPLFGFHNRATWVTAWKPTPEQLERLNAGEPVYVSVMSGSRHDVVGDKVIPNIIPMYVGMEEDVLAVVSDTGGVWK